VKIARGDTIGEIFQCSILNHQFACLSSPLILSCIVSTPMESRRGHLLVACVILLLLYIKFSPFTYFGVKYDLSMVAKSINQTESLHAALNARDLYAEEGFASWLDGCRLLYLDVGTNRGVQIRKLFEPHLYPGAPVLKVFDEMFGLNRSTMKDLCAVGWEPNIHHASFLKVCIVARAKQCWIWDAGWGGMANAFRFFPE